jgi:nucleotide-binding universal stress UspA family protein
MLDSGLAVVLKPLLSKIDETNRGVIMKIMVGYDGSDLGGDVLKLARKWARGYSASIEVVFVMAQDRELQYPDIQKVEDMMQKAAKNIFDGHDIPYETHLMITKLSPGEELVEFAKHNKIDEIIIGVKRKSKAGKFIFGSTAQYVILNAPCPVVTLK